MPTQDEINEIKNRQILDNARRHIEDDDLDDYVKVIRDNYPKKDYLKMAAGLLKMMREN